VVRFLSNPIFLHGAIVLFCASFAFLLGMIFMRQVRKSIQEEADISSDTPAFEALPLHVYNTVIRQLKQQQDELKTKSQAEQQRSRTTERFYEAVLSNLFSGVLGVGRNGVVKSTNPAAKQILGFASPVGMSVQDIFRGAISDPHSNSGEVVREENSDVVLVSDEFDSILHSTGARREIQAEYETPAGETRSLSMIVIPLPGSDGSIAGAACLINDVTELMQLRRRVGNEDSRESRAAGAGV
jgi:nitrogen fixation/metabolism regulation signal transduction histidine kinase